jgi:hypothetical protein
MDDPMHDLYLAPVGVCMYVHLVGKHATYTYTRTIQQDISPCRCSTYLVAAALADCLYVRIFQGRSLLHQSLIACYALLCTALLAPRGTRSIRPVERKLASAFVTADAKFHGSQHHKISPPPTRRSCVRLVHVLRASPATSPVRPSAPIFFHPDSENRSSRAPGSSFSPGFGPSSIWRAQAIPAFRGVLGDSGRKKRMRNGGENYRASCGPELSAREALVEKRTSIRPH